VKFSAGLIIGFLLGTGSVLLLQRIKERIDEDDPERLSDRISGQLASLELRAEPKAPQRA
jgi:hypothetical protein